MLSVADQGARRPWPPGPVKIIVKKMATKGGCIDFLFLDPSTQPLDPLLAMHVIGPYPLANVVTAVAEGAILTSDYMGVIYVVLPHIEMYVKHK